MNNLEVFGHIVRGNKIIPFTPRHGERIQGMDGTRVRPEDKIVLRVVYPETLLMQRATVYVDKTRDGFQVLEKRRIDKSRTEDPTKAEYFISAFCKPLPMRGDGVFIDQNQGQCTVMELLDGKLIRVQLGVVVQHGIPFFVQQESAMALCRGYENDEGASSTPAEIYRCPELEGRDTSGDFSAELLAFMDERFPHEIGSLPPFDGRGFEEVSDEVFVQDIPVGRGRVRWFNPVRGTGAIVVRRGPKTVELVKLYYKNILAPAGTFHCVKQGDVVTMREIRPVTDDRSTFTHEAIGVKVI